MPKPTSVSDSLTREHALLLSLSITYTYPSGCYEIAEQSGMTSLPYKIKTKNYSERLINRLIIVFT